MGIYFVVKKPPNVSGKMAYGFFNTIAPAAAFVGVYSLYGLAFTLRRERVERQAEEMLEAARNRIENAERVVIIDDSLPTYQEVTKDEIHGRLSECEIDKTETPPSFEAAMHL